MKIFGWMRNKLNASMGGTNEPNPKSMPPDHDKRDQACKEEFFDWPNELLSIGTFGLKESDKSNNIQGILPAPKQETSEELDVKTTDELDVEENRDSYLQRTTSFEKNIQSDNLNSGIRKKSLTFILKKAFLCSGGFTPNPMLRDPHPILDKSRIEKILRAMLHRKIYPQRSNNSKGTSNKCLHMPTDVDEEEEHQVEKSKWDKTDAEYIVLEI